MIFALMDSHHVKSEQRTNAFVGYWSPLFCLLTLAASASPMSAVEKRGKSICLRVSDSPAFMLATANYETNPKCARRPARSRG